MDNMQYNYIGSWFMICQRFTSNHLIPYKIADSVKGVKKLCIVGDNFMATTYRPNFKKSKSDFYMKNQFEVTGFCSSKYSDANRNPLSRLQITLAAGVNAKDTLPDFIIMLIDNELLEFLDFNGCGMAIMLGNWIERLSVEFWSLIENKLKMLPMKGKLTPQIYWVIPPNSDHFEHDLWVAHAKFASVWSL